jgi:hypothetical protein
MHSTAVHMRPCFRLRQTSITNMKRYIPHPQCYRSAGAMQATCELFTYGAGGDRRSLQQRYTIRRHSYHEPKPFSPFHNRLCQHSCEGLADCSWFTTRAKPAVRISGPRRPPGAHRKGCHDTDTDAATSNILCHLTWCFLTIDGSQRPVP